MTAFSRDRIVAGRGGDQARFAQACAGRDHRKARAFDAKLTLLQGQKLGWTQMGDAVCGCLKVIHKMGAGDTKGGTDGTNLHHPPDIDGVAAAIDDRARHTEANRVECPLGTEEELGDLFERIKISRGEKLVADHLEVGTLGLEQAEMGLGAADITGQNYACHDVRSVSVTGLKG